MYVYVSGGKKYQYFGKFYEHIKWMIMRDISFAKMLPVLISNNTYCKQEEFVKQS